MSLNHDQQRCFNAFMEGKPMVITGPAGCGKSFLIKEIKSYCNNHMINIAVTALTGAAASLVSGQTLHGWSGIGLGKGSSREIYNNMARYRPQNVRRWQDTKVLIIDEISMMDASLFNKLHMLGQIINKNTTDLFGGIQVILCGDFAQLKPIVEHGTTLKFAFESATWQTYLAENTFYLSEIMRQTDPVFQGILTRIRLGCYTSKDKEILNSRLITSEDEADLVVELADGSERIIKATMLFPRKKDVDRINQSELHKLLARGVTSKSYKSSDTVIHKRSHRPVQVTEQHVKTLNNCTSAPVSLVLTEGAQVMLIKNKDVESGLVNGSRGVVTGFDGSNNPIVMFDNGIQMPLGPEKFESEVNNNILSRLQVPLILAWALTIHKCQGATLTNVITDLTEVFDEAQVYVTLSRARSLDGLFIINLNYAKIRCNSRVKKYYHAIATA